MARQFFVFGLIALLALWIGVTPARQAHANNVVTVSAGDEDSCAVTTAGGVKCWGDNGGGQLGVGTNTGPETCGVEPCSTTPVDVAGLSSGASAVSVGGAFSCALTTAGGVKCWGINYTGQLGNGTTVASRVPVDVSGLTTGVAAISSGNEHACALTAAGAVKCWGANYDGQLGDGTYLGPQLCGMGINTVGCSTTPVDVSGLTSGAASVSAGPGFTCAVTTAGGVKCWGSNLLGELGDGIDNGPEQCARFEICSTVPVDVCTRPTYLCMNTVLMGVSAVSVGGVFAEGHACALSNAGGVKCWGSNGEGVLGDGSSIGGRDTAVDVAGLTSGVTDVSAGGLNTCAVTAAGGVKCWGVLGTLGNAYITSSTPVDVSGLTAGVAAISAGDGHTCALTTAGGVKCWGDNTFGQLGDGTTNDSSMPVDVVSLGPKPVGGISFDPGVAFSTARSASRRSPAVPFAALAVVSVSTGAGAIWLARRRLRDSR